MEASLKDDDVAFSRSMTCQFDAGLYGFSSAVGEKERVNGRGRDFIKRFGQCYRHGRDDDIHLTEDELFGLLLNGLYHSRVTMTRVGDSNSAGEVRVAVANGVEEINGCMCVR